MEDFSDQNKDKIKKTKQSLKYFGDSRNLEEENQKAKARSAMNLAKFGLGLGVANIIYAAYCVYGNLSCIGIGDCGTGCAGCIFYPLLIGPSIIALVVDCIVAHISTKKAEHGAETMDQDSISNILSNKRTGLILSYASVALMISLIVVFIIRNSSF